MFQILLKNIWTLDNGGCLASINLAPSWLLFPNICLPIALCTISYLKMV